MEARERVLGAVVGPENDFSAWSQPKSPAFAETTHSGLPTASETLTVALLLAPGTHTMHHARSTLSTRRAASEIEVPVPGAAARA